MSEQKEIEDDIVVIEDDTADLPAEPEIEEDSAPADGEVDSSDDDEGEQRKKKRKRGGNPQAKIKELWQRTQDDRIKMAQLEQARIAAEQKAGRFQEIAVNSTEANLAAQKKYLQQELQLAHEVADAKTIASLTVELGNVLANESQVTRYKTESFIDGKAPEPRAAEIAQDDAPLANDFESLYESGSMATKKWLDESRDWYDPDSDAHDEEKAADVTFYARNLERQLISSGRAAEIGTSSYYKEIRKYVSDNYDDEGAVVEKKTFTRSNSGGAAPVISRSPNNQPAKKSVTITGAERDMAVSLNLRHPNGNDYSDQEKIRAYISGKVQTSKKG